MFSKTDSRPPRARADGWFRLEVGRAKLFGSVCLEGGGFGSGWLLRLEVVWIRLFASGWRVVGLGQVVWVSLVGSVCLGHVVQVGWVKLGIGRVIVGWVGWVGWLVGWSW